MYTAKFALQQKTTGTAYRHVALAHLLEDHQIAPYAGVEYALINSAGMQDKLDFYCSQAHSIGALELDCGGLIVPVNFKPGYAGSRCILLIGERRETDNLHVRATGLAQLPDEQGDAQRLLGFPTRIRSILLFSYVHVCHNQKVRLERTAFAARKTDRNAAANIFELHFKANASLHTLYQPGIFGKMQHHIPEHCRPFPLLTITTRTHLLSDFEPASYNTGSPIRPILR